MKFLPRILMGACILASPAFSSSAAKNDLLSLEEQLKCKKAHVSNSIALTLKNIEIGAHNLEYASKIAYKQKLPERTLNEPERRDFSQGPLRAADYEDLSLAIFGKGFLPFKDIQTGEIVYRRGLYLSLNTEYNIVDERGNYLLAFPYSLTPFPQNILQTHPSLSVVYLSPYTTELMFTQNGMIKTCTEHESCPLSAKHLAPEYWPEEQDLIPRYQLYMINPSLLKSSTDFIYKSHHSKNILYKPNTNGYGKIVQFALEESNVYRESAHIKQMQYYQTLNKLITEEQRIENSIFLSRFIRLNSSVENKPNL